MASAIPITLSSFISPKNVFHELQPIGSMTTLLESQLNVDFSPKKPDPPSHFFNLICNNLIIKKSPKCVCQSQFSMLKRSLSDQDFLLAILDLEKNFNGSFLNFHF